MLVPTLVIRSKVAATLPFTVLPKLIALLVVDSLVLAPSVTAPV